MAKTEILLIEDAAADVKLISIALRTSVPDLDLRVARDGDAGMNELTSKRPDLLLLDLNIPKRNGLEVLDEIRADSLLRTLPVIILTNSTSPKDVDAAYRSCCNAYVRKPVGFDKLMEVVESIKHFWIDFSIIPS